MTQEDKELLLKDLCGRLPYGVIGQCGIDASYDTSFDTIFQIHKFDAVVYGIKEDLLLVTPLIEDKDEQEFANEEVADGVDILDFKPYLFPISSMTEEQKNEFDARTVEIMFGEVVCKKNDEIGYGKLMAFDLDFYNKHHLDWRGLIPMGLAEDATGLNIY